MLRKQVLILSSVASMIDQFNMPNINLLIEMGYKVHVACNFDEGNTCSCEQVEILKDNLLKLDVAYYQVDFKRNIMRLHDNIKAYKQVYNLVKENNYKFIHCHSPIGGVVARLIGNITRTKVIYTAHGFHFYKGAPLKNWILYYPIEKMLSRYTDVLITINKEDFSRAKRKFKAKNIEYIPGVGIDTEKFRSVIVKKELKRQEVGIPKDSFVILSVGELNKNKNHEVIIKAIARLCNPQIHYIICGKGPAEKYLVSLIKRLNISNQVHLLGFRTDVASIYKISDVFAFPSLREGLGMAALEAMACGLPIITSNVHGIVDYSFNGVTGYVCNPTDIEKFANAIELLANDEVIRNKIKEYNLCSIKKFNIKESLRVMAKVYEKYYD